MENKLLIGFPGFLQSRRSQRATVLPHFPSVTAWDAGILDSFHQGDSSVMPTHMGQPLGSRGSLQKAPVSSCYLMP